MRSDTIVPMAHESVRKSLLALIAWLACVVASSPARAQSPTAHADDTTSVSEKDQDPLRWTAGHEIQFTGRCKTGGADLRSGPDPAYPVMKHLAGGEPLLVVDSRKEFLAVLVPDGYHAYVKREFVALGEDGTGVIRGASVNLRSRPSTENDYPIGSLPSGTNLWIIGPADKEDSWLEVIAPDVPIWISDSELDISGEITDPAFQKEIAQARIRRRTDWVTHSVGAREAETKRAAERELAGTLKTIEAAVKAEREKGANADYSAVRSDLKAVLGTATSKSVRESAEGLLADIDAEERRAAREREIEQESARLKGELAAEKQRLADAQKRAADESKNLVGPRVTVGDPAQISGFLRSKGAGASAQFSLEKGAITSAYVRSSDGRYRIDDFVGLQVEIRGRFVQGGATPYIEVERLTILRR